MTVEELRKQVLDNVKGGYHDWAEMVEDVDSLISAVEAQTRQKIRNTLDVTFVGGAEMTWRFDSRKWYIVPYSALVPDDSLLAPDKESEK